MRTCSQCKVAKPDSEYGKHPKGLNGLQSRCYACCAANSRAYYRRNYREHPERWRNTPDEMRSYRRTPRGLLCLRFSSMRGRVEGRGGPQSDRIDPARGYERSNVRWLTHSENSRRATVARHAKGRN